MNRRLLFGAGGVLVAALLVAGTASASTLAPERGAPLLHPQQSPTPTATVRPGGPPPDRPGNGRPEGAGTPGANRPDGTGTPGAQPGQGLDRQPPQLPPQASPRARAAVAAAALLHDRLRDRIQALRALPPGPGRNDAVKAVMGDFGDLFHLVSDAVHAVEPGKPTATPTATSTATSTATATATATP